MDLRHQCHRFHFQRSSAKVTCDPALQTFGFADVQDFALLIEHAVDARPGGQRLEKGFVVEFGHFTP